MNSETLSRDHDYWIRAQLVQVQMAKVQLRADHAAAAYDLVALEACRDEMNVLYQSMLDIRSEQLTASLERNKPKRRWWQRRERITG
jgi:hypothetical protein